MIVDVSGSLGSADAANSRITKEIQAVDSAIKKLMDSNAYARVGVVLFDGNAFVLAPLEHYDSIDAPYYDDGEEYYFIKAEHGAGDYTITFVYKDETGTEQKITKKSKSDTNLQAAYYVGMKMLENADNLDVTIYGEQYKRIPSVIMFTDGDPDSASDYSTWWAPSMLRDTENTDQEENWHSSQNRSDELRAMKTMMTAAYMKGAVARHYGEQVSIYTIGLEIEDNIVAKLVLNPNQYLVEHPEQLEDVSVDAQTVIKNIYRLWNEYKNGGTPRFFRRNYSSSGEEPADDYRFYHPWDERAYQDKETNTYFARGLGDEREPYLDNPYGDSFEGDEYGSTTQADITSLKNIEGYNTAIRNAATPEIKKDDYMNQEYDVTDINYVDKYFDVKSENIETVLNNVINEVTLESFRPVGGSVDDKDNLLSYSDPIGKYMEVKDVKKLMLFGEEYEVVEDKLETENVNDQEITRQYYKAVGAGGNDLNISNPNYTKNANFNLSDIKIYVETSNEYDTDEESKINTAFDQAIYISIPSRALPIQLDTITLNEEDEVESFESSTGNAVLPIRVAYTVGLSNSIMNDGRIDLTKVSKEYIEANKVGEKIRQAEDKEYVYFYSNYYSAEDYDGDGINETTFGNASTTYSVSEDNRFYIYQKNLPIYKTISGANEKGEGELTETGGQVTLTDEVKDMTEIDENGTYYIAIDYYDPIFDESGKQQDKKGKLVQYAIPRKGSELLGNITYYDKVSKEEVTESGENTVVATKIGGKRIGNLNQLTMLKKENKTSTATYYYVPTYGSGDDVQTYQLVNYMGNNGRISIEDSLLRIAKKIDKEIPEDVKEYKEFKFKLYLEKAQGTKNVILTEWDGNDWKAKLDKVTVTTNNEGYILNTNGEATEYWVGNIEEQRKVDENGMITVYSDSEKNGGSTISVYDEDEVTPIFQLTTLFKTKELVFNEIYENGNIKYGVAEFTLKADEAIYLDNLSSGTNYIIEELIVDGEDGFKFSEVKGIEMPEELQNIDNIETMEQLEAIERYAEIKDVVDKDNKRILGEVNSGTLAEATFINNYDPLSIKLTKVWDDSDDKTDVRPDSVKLVLLANGKTAIDNAGKEVYVILSEVHKIENNNNKWQYTFDNLARVDKDGKEIEYSLREEEVKEGDLYNYYRVKIEGNRDDGFTVTNKLSDIIANKTSNKTEDVVKKGDIITYTIKVKNNVDEQKVVKIKDKIPEGTTFVNESIRLEPAQGTSTYTVEDLTENGIDATIAVGGEVTLTFQVEVTGEGLVNDDYISNIGEITDGENIKDTNIVRDIYKGPDMVATKTAKIVEANGRDYAIEGDEIEYSIEVLNKGEAEGVANIKDQIPDGTTFVEESITVTPTQTEATEKYTINDLTEKGIDLKIKEKETAIVTFKVRVDGFKQGEGHEKEIQNIAVLNEEKNIPSDPVRVQKAYMVVHKTSPNAGQEVKIGDTIQYQITVSNEGKIQGTAKVIDPIPNGTEFKEGSIRIIPEEKANNKTYTEQDLTTNGIEIILDPEENVTITFEVKVTGKGLNHSYIIENTAFIQEGEQKTQTETVEHELLTAKINTLKSAIIKDPHLGYVHEGETITYKVEVSNDGGLDEIVNIKDVIPDGTTFVKDSIKINDKHTTYTEDDLSKNGINIDVLPTSGEKTRKLKIMENPPTIEDLGIGSITKAQSCFSDGKCIYPLENGDISNVFTSYNAELWVDGEGINGYYYNQKGVTDENPIQYSIEFTVDCQEFIFGVKTKYFRVYVDEGNGYEMTSYDGTVGVNSQNYYKVTFTSKKQRNIKLELPNRFYGVILHENDTLTKIDREVNEKVLFIGDGMAYSYPINQQMGYKSYVNVISDILGLEMMNQSGDGIGYIEDDDGKSYIFKEKLEKLVPKLKPNVVILQGGRQDISRDNSVEDTMKNAEECIKLLKETYPEVKVILIGVWTGRVPGYTSSTLENQKELNTQLRKKALENNIPYIDLITGETITGDGKVITNIGPYITDENVNDYVINLDLTIKGHRYMGEKLAEEVYKILNDVDIVETSPVTLSFDVTVNDLDEGTYKKTLENTAEVNEKETNTVYTDVKKPNIEVIKTAEPEGNTKVLKDEDITYTIKVTNTGSEEKTFSIKDTIPTGTSLKPESIKIKGNQSTENPEEFLTETGMEVTLGPDEVITIEFTVTVTGEELKDGDIITNTAYVDGTQTNEVQHPYSKPAVSSIKEAEIVGAGDRTYALEGEKIRYKIKLTNEGDTKETVKVRDEIPKGTIFVSNSIVVEPTQGKNYTKEQLIGEGIDVEVPAKEGEKLGEVTVTFEVQVEELPEETYTETISNIATVGENQTNEVTTEVKKPNVIATKEATLQGKKVRYGQKITYTIKLDNTTGTAEDTVLVTDELPNGVAFVGTTLSITMDGEEIETCDINEFKQNGVYVTVPEGKIVEVNMDVMVIGDGLDENQKITNVARVDEVPTNDVTHTYITEEPEITSKIEKTSTIEKINRKDQEITYKIKYEVTIDKYIGDAKVTIVDTLPFKLNETNLTPEKLNNGIYSEETETGTYTITWEQKISGINTYQERDEEGNLVSVPRKEIIEKEITISYKDVDVTLPNITNRVSGTIELLNKEKEQTVEAEKSIEQEYKVNIKVIKKWDDSNNQEEKRPGTIKVKLYAGDALQGAQDLTGDSTQEQWECTFENLNKYDNTGLEIQYRVDEEIEESEGSNYYKKTEVSNIEEKSPGIYEATITNKFEVPREEIEIVINKKWVDFNNRAGKRPSSITVKAIGTGEYQNESKTGYETKSYTYQGEMTGEGGTEENWTITIKVPKYDDRGNKVQYKIDEEEIEGGLYKKTSVGDLQSTEKGYEGTIVNTFEVPQERTTVTVTKVWEDDDNANGVRPEKIVVNLIGRGMKKQAEDSDVVEEGEIVNESIEMNSSEYGEESTWEYTFDNLPRYDEYGNEIEYTVDEEIEGESNYYEKHIGGRIITNQFKRLNEGTVVVTKKDSVDGTGLKGARFELQDGEGNILRLMKIDGIYRYSEEGTETELESGEEGELRIEGLPMGNYALVEIEAPEGYVRDEENSRHEFTIDISKYQEEGGNLVNIPEEIEITNDRIEIGIKKVDEQGLNLAGAKLQLLDEQRREIEQWDTGLEEEHIITAIKKGKYIIKELEAPEGYEIAPEMEIEVIEQKERQEFIVTNRLSKLRLEVTKVDARYKQIQLEGAIFKLEKGNYDEEGIWKVDQSFTPIEKTTDDRGKVEYEDIEYGIYRIYEMKAPYGYIIKREPTEVRIDEETLREGNVVRVEVENVEKMELPVTGSKGIGEILIVGMIVIGCGMIREKMKKKV